MDPRGVLVSVKALIASEALDAPLTYQTLDAAPLDSLYWDILTTVTSYEIALSLLAGADSDADDCPEKRALIVQSLDRSLDRLGALLSQIQRSY